MILMVYLYLNQENQEERGSSWGGRFNPELGFCTTLILIYRFHNYVSLLKIPENSISDCASYVFTSCPTYLNEMIISEAFINSL